MLGRFSPKKYFIFFIFAFTIYTSDGIDVKPVKCKFAKADIIFVLDRSFSVGKENWEKQVRFLKELTTPFTINLKSTRIGVVIFGTGAEYQLKLSKSTNEKTVSKNILNMKYVKNQITYMGEGLEKARIDFMAEGRLHVPRVVVLITDGKANGLLNPVEEAEMLKKMGIPVVAVGITSSVNEAEMKEIATSGQYFKASNFMDLAGSLLINLENLLCRITHVKTCKKTVADVTFMLDSSTSIGPTNWRTILNFVERVIDPMFIGEKQGHVACMTFNTLPHLQFLYRKYLNKVDLITKGIRGVVYSEGLTNTGKALQFFRLKVFPKMRKNVAKIVVLITDGFQNGHISDINESKMLKGMGVIFITVGVTNKVNRKYLLKISSEKKMYYVTEYSKLKGILTAIQGEVCKDIERIVTVKKRN